MIATRFDGGGIRKGLLLRLGVAANPFAGSAGAQRNVFLGFALDAPMMVMADTLDPNRGHLPVVGGANRRLNRLRHCALLPACSIFVTPTVTIRHKKRG